MFIHFDFHRQYTYILPSLRRYVDHFVGDFVNTLDYLKKGGRITPAAAMLGTVLSIKPILTIQGEKLDSYAKSRGTMKKAELRMIEALQNDLKKRFSGKNMSDLHIGAAGAGLTACERDEWVRC